MAASAPSNNTVTSPAPPPPILIPISPPRTHNKAPPPNQQLRPTSVAKLLSLERPTVHPLHEDRYKKLSTEEKENHAGQYYGYPALARHMASHHDFLVLRRFAPLQVRCLLYLQAQICRLETHLKAWDEYVEKQPSNFGCSKSILEDDYPERTNTIEQLLPLLQKYDDLVEAFAKIRSRPTARRHHFTNIDHWFETYEDSIAESERFDLGNHGDLFPVVPIPKAPIFKFLERLTPLRWLFETSVRSDHDPGGLAEYWSDTAFTYLTTFLVIFSGLGLLFGPIWWLNFVQHHTTQLAIVTGFTTLFTVCLFAAAGNRPFEILGAVAAYTAVLMIYRQLGTPS